MTEKIINLTEYKQAHPKKVDGPAIVELVKKDLTDRLEFGIMKYGEPVRAGDGRRGLIDLYEELLDAAIYCRKLLEEENVKGNI